MSVYKEILEKLNKIKEDINKLDKNLQSKREEYETIMSEVELFAINLSLLVLKGVYKSDQIDIKTYPERFDRDNLFAFLNTESRVFTIYLYDGFVDPLVIMTYPERILKSFEL